MRILGVDWGGSRIGIAIGEEFLVEGKPSHVCAPRSLIQASGTLKIDALNIIKIAKEENATAIAIGVPEYEGDEKGAKLTRMIAQLCREQGWQTHEVNESMTTIESHDALKEIGLSAAQRKSRIDSESACRILDRYFSENL